MSDEERRFTDLEAYEILSRAAEREERQDEGGAVGAFSLVELERIAAEAGIDPTHVSAAARELALRRDGPGDAVEGAGSQSLQRIRHVPAPLGSRAWERVVGVLREEFGRNGIVTDFGSAREWTSADEQGSIPVRVRVAPGVGGTDVVIRQDLEGLKWYPALVGGPVASVPVLIVAILLILGETLQVMPLLMFLVAALVVTGGTWLAVRRYADRQDARFLRVLDRVELVLREEEAHSGDVRTLPTSPPPDTPRGSR